MNIWYVISLSLVGLGIVIFIGCLIASIVGISRKTKTLNETSLRIQEQLAPIQTNIMTLNSTLGRIMMDIELKRSELRSLLENANKIKNNIMTLIKNSKDKTKRIIDQTNNDPVIQDKTEQWINTALGYRKR